MIPRANVVKRRPVQGLTADRAAYRVILDDMLRHAGALIPDPNWLMTDNTSLPADRYDKAKSLEVAQSDQHYLSKIATMESLLDAWVGGAEPPSHRALDNYQAFLQHCDLLDLWANNVERAEPGRALARQDLGTLMDLNLLYAFAPTAQTGPTTILEVGGGYGRLAEAAFNVFGNTIRYVMLDAVPASLHYARLYLAAACPDARVGSYYDSPSGDFDISQYDIAIVPAWHFERLNKGRYDVCVNIESMQEMNQHHVDYYLQLFEAVSSPGATIYLSNAHDYYFKGAFHYPSNWQRLFYGNTPRSWRTDHPTEIFRKTDRDCTRENQPGEALYQYRNWMDASSDEFVERNGVRAMTGPFIRKLGKAVAAKLPIKRSAV